jgi:hydroxyacylglutathione hydrolase
VFLKNRRDFVAHKLSVKMARPPNFRHLEQINLLPGRPLKWPSTYQVLQPREFQ